MSIDFTCPKCGQFYSVDDDLAGCPAECEDCGTQFDVPEPAREAARPPKTARPTGTPGAPASERPPVTLLKSSLDIDIERGGMTISQFMSKRGIEGGVGLDSDSGSSASELLKGPRF